jgi:uncharacterized membrane protein
MRTQQERDDALIGSVHKVISHKSHSTLRIALIAAVTALVGVWQLSLPDGWFASLMGFVLIIFALLLIGEGARLGLTFARLYSGWTSTSAILIGFAICFGIARLFEYWSLLPLHRTAFWSLAIWFGFLLGVMLFFAAETDES